MNKTEPFEIHITGDESIIVAAEQLGVKAITIELLKPDYSFFRMEYMTSQVMKFNNFQECKSRVDDLVDSLIKKGVSIKRVKIESPILEHYKNIALYLETHFPTQDAKLPISRNTKKKTFLSTDRIYTKDKWDAFVEFYKGKELELALYDTNPNEDLDWFCLYERNKESF